MTDRPRQNVLADLGLAGDLDELDMVRDVELAFGVVFENGISSWTTVGDIEASLARLFPPSPDRGRCATAMAFYALRRQLYPTRKVSPKEKLAALGTRSCIGTFGELERDLGLRMPTAPHSSASGWGGALVVLGMMGTVPANEYLGLWWPGPAAVLLGGMLMGADRGSFGEATLGDLARDVALLNYGAFAARGADRRPETIWATLRHLVCRQTGVDPDAVARTTRIFAK